jgi:hypothetical protein
MKTNLRVMVLGVGLMSLVLCAGCDQPSANAQEAPAKTDATPPVVAAADEPKPADTKPADTKPADTKPADAKPAEVKPAEAKPAEPAPAPPAPPAPIEAPAAAPGPADPNLVQNPMPPDQLKLTPALADVIKLVQSGVGEEVLMTYITNSADIFNIGPNEILYLHDLGVPNPIITSLIQQDSTPEAMARKQAANAVQPLPPGVALNKPATNIFPPKAAAVPAPTPAPETAQVVTSEPPAETNPAPEVVYTVPTEVQQPVNVSYFYTELAPYGTWVDYPGYGRCWRPTVSVWNSSWRPYCDGGRWLWSNCGWYWYSDYTWGASTFHYGRWTCPPGSGWLWVPDVHWGPSWVSWRHTRSHCAWAPLPPSARYVAGRGLYHNTLSVGADHEFGLSKDAYVALPKNQMLARRPSNHYLSARHAETVINESSVANNYATINKTVVNHGVGVDSISKASGREIRPVSIRSADTVGPRNPRRELLDADGKTLAVARPVNTAPVIAPPDKPISSLSGQRTRSERHAATVAPQTSTASGAANNSARKGTPAAPAGPTVVPSGRAAAPIIMRGNGRTAGASSTASAVAQPATGQPATTPGSATKPAANNTAPQRAALPGGRRPASETVERSRSAAQVAATRPAPATPAIPAAQPSRTSVARTEPARGAPQPVVVQRAPSGPAPVQPRVIAPAAPSPAPVFRAAPSAPVGPTVSPRVDSYRAPSPAPAARAPAPAPSSGGGSRSSYSRDSSGAPRGSR